MNAGAGERSPVSVRIFRPSPELQSYITFYHVVDVAGALTDFLYPEWGNVRFALAGTWHVRMPRRVDPTPQQGALFGPTDRHGRIETAGGRTFGFGLTPIGWSRLIGEPAAPMANRIRPLARALGVDGIALDAELCACTDDLALVERIEAVLYARLAATAPVRDELRRLDSALRDNPPTVAAFAQAMQATPVRLRRLCLELFGFPTKRMIRMQRFLEVLGHVRTAVGDPVVPSIAGAYFDAPHFHRDFRDFMAMSARDYFGAARPLMAEAALAQARAGVTLSFALPPTPTG